MKTKFKSQRKGAVLMTVVVVSTMMVVIVGAAVALVAHTNYRTNKEYRMKQAYFAASSTLETFVAEVTRFSKGAGYSTDDIAAEIDKLQRLADGQPATVKINKINPGGSIGGDISDDNARWNDVEVTLKLEKLNGSSSELKAISTATYLTETKTVIAYLAVKPVNKKKTVLNALEMMNANSSGAYNNINVFGSTAAPDMGTHDKNAIFDFTSNHDEFYGDMSMYGSVIGGDHMKLTANPYYIETAATDSDEGHTPGCTFRVSRSLLLTRNSPDFSSDLVKTYDFNRSPNGANRDFYNFIDAREAFVMSATSGAVIGGPGIGGSVWKVAGVDYSAYETTDEERDSIADPTARMVDVYSSLFVMGNANFVPQILDWCASTAEDPAAYKSKASGMQNGNTATIYGNVYTYKKDSIFNGDVYLVGLHNAIYGDIYCSGNIYVKNDGTYSGREAVKGKVFLAEGGRVYDMDHMNQDITSQWEAEGILFTGNWENTKPRAERPYSLDSTESDHALDPYYYYPEHLLCEPAISTIHKTYKAMYGTGSKVNDGDGRNDYITRQRYSPNGSGFVEDDSGSYIRDDAGNYYDIDNKYEYHSWDGTYALITNPWYSGDSYLKGADGSYVLYDPQKHYYNYRTFSSFKANKSGNTLTYKGWNAAGAETDYTITNNTYVYTYTDAYNVSHTETLQPSGFDPQHVITASCVLDQTMGDVLIDLDHAKKNEDGRYDIVIMMNKDVRLINDPLTRIFVKNFEHGTDSDDPRFVYFVSDSGVGTTKDDYGLEKKPSTYSKFKYAEDTDPQPVYAAGNGKMYLMNLADYCHSSLQDSSQSLDPTGRHLSPPAYDVPSGGIFFIITKHHKLQFGQETVIQANIFMPEANFLFQNNGVSCNIEPKYSVWGEGPLNKLCLLGSLCCGVYEPSANNNTIVFQPPSDKSMLAFVHGAPDEARTESFQLVRYASA